MNPKSKIKVLPDKGVIEMNKTYAKMAENPFSDEYTHLQSFRRDYPLFSVRVREIKTNPSKESYKGLTYQYMEDYIITHESDETRATVLHKYHELRLITQCHSRAFRYPVIKKWFLEKYPEIASFGMAAAAAPQGDNVTNFPDAAALENEEKMGA